MTVTDWERAIEALVSNGGSCQDFDRSNGMKNWYLMSQLTR